MNQVRRCQSCHTPGPVARTTVRPVPVAGDGGPPLCRYSVSRMHERNQDRISQPLILSGRFQMVVHDVVMPSLRSGVTLQASKPGPSPRSSPKSSPPQSSPAGPEIPVRLTRSQLAARRTIDESYFQSYGEFGIHKEMLSDKVTCNPQCCRCPVKLVPSCMPGHHCHAFDMEKLGRGQLGYLRGL